MEKLIQWVSDLNANPNPDFVKKNEDGSLYLPISYTQKLLDEVFLGQWSFEMTQTQYGRKWARGSGIMTVVNPITQHTVKRGGDAGILLTGNLRTDSPRLEAMVLLSCAKKFGRVFGRDLNRDKDDAPLPVVRLEKVERNSELERLSLLIDQCHTKEELQQFQLLAKSKGLLKEFNKKLKSLENESNQLG